MVTPLEILWKDTCDVITRGKTRNSKTKLTEFGEKVVLSGVPCKFSWSSHPSTTGENVAEQKSTYKLFLNRDYVIPTGSKVVVHRGSYEFVGYHSGERAIFSKHQEIELEKFERWA